MKILYHHRVAARDGMDVHITELVRAFRDQGHDVLMVGPERGSESNFGKSGTLVSKLRQFLPKAAGEILEVLYDRLAYWRLRAAYRSFQPDVLYERHNLFLTAGKRLHETYGIPYLLEVNSPLAAERAAHGGLALKSFATNQEAAVWRAATHVFPVSGVLAKMLIEKGVDPARITVVHNAINTEMFHQEIDGSPIRERFGFHKDDVVLGFTGFIRSWHGLDKVIDALSTPDFPENVKLFVVGDGPHRAVLERQAKSLGVDHRVVFSGLVPRQKMPEHIVAFDIALQPAVTPYASPLKLFEYLAMGKAIIGPNQENIREVLNNESDALLVNSDEELRSAIVRLANDKLLRQQLSLGALKNISDRAGFWHENAKRILYKITNTPTGHPNADPSL